MQSNALLEIYMLVDQIVLLSIPQETSSLLFFRVFYGLLELAYPLQNIDILLKILSFLLFLYSSKAGVDLVLRVGWPKLRMG